ncbi:MAG: hypothetical protein E7052_03265 [Lentisphaerae bacterium]|nr:hypothetical protein [Lentisphaerota bacterium]
MYKTLIILLLFILLLPLKSENLRVVSLAPALTEIICSLGGEKYLVGRCSACDYPESVKALPEAGRFGIPELERIIKLRPTWVIGNDFMNNNIAKKLRELKIEVNLQQINTPEDYLKWVQLAGRKLNLPEQAAKLIEQFKVQQKVLNSFSPHKLKVLWVVNAKPLMAAGPGSLPDRSLELMQLENAAGKVDAAYFKCAPEWLLSHQIDLIIWGVPEKIPAQNRIWKNVPAVQKNAVIYHDVYDPVTRPGPRFMQALIELRHRIDKLGSSKP